ncbi:MAG: cyclic pyranopterin monophosphate synthase MoaC [Verrucomicrobiota bacterium]
MGALDDGLTHLSEEGEASMVDVSGKAKARREAVARGFIRLKAETLRLVEADGVAKGNVLAVARVAGIQAAKQTGMLVPLCHPLPLSFVSVDFELGPEGIEIRSCARTTAETGVEMEALTAVSVAALTIYDMCKAVDKSMRIEGVELVSKKKSAVIEA